MSASTVALERPLASQRQTVGDSARMDGRASGSGEHFQDHGRQRTGALRRRELPAHAMQQCDGVLVGAKRWSPSMALYNVAPSENTSEAKFASFPLATSEPDRPACRAPCRSW